MWDTLEPPWQAALEMAWEAYCVGTIPIGAVIADADGNIVARGRNRIMDSSAPENQVCANELAHAELNALLALKLDYYACKDRGVALYTTMEPCPLCMGALYMSDVKTVHYAARDPWAGSANLLGTTPYLSLKAFRAIPPFDPTLENASSALCVVHSINKYGEDVLTSRYHNTLREALPTAVETGVKLYRSGQIAKFKEQNAATKEVFEYLSYQVQ
jgi:tRNA(adenine34) deaminase